MENNNLPWWWEFKDEMKAILNSEVELFLNGGELTNVEVSQELNVLPTGSYHKNKHDDFGIDVTKKGIPVITVEDDSVETLEEIQEQSDSVIQHAEIEKMEVVFSKETTDFIEANRKLWNESKSSDIELEVGKRITKELLMNTKDEGGIIEKLEDLA